MSGRSQLARAVAGIGGGTLARAWRRARRAPGRAIVLMYHRVSDDADYLGMAVRPAVFARQLAVLRRRTRVVSMAALVARLGEGAPLDDDLSAVTFDDGYRDNLEVALPLLRAHDVPATVFVSTEFIDGTRRPAGERLRTACEALWRRRTQPDAWGGETDVDARIRALLAVPGSLDAVAQLRQALKSLPHDGEDVMRRLETVAGDDGAGPRSMLDWDGVRSLARAGVEIGSHAMSHGILSRLSFEQSQHEIRASKTRLEAELGHGVAGFAFPNGRRGDFVPAHLTALRQAGYAYACTAETGTNLPGCDAYQLLRIGVGNDSEGLLDLKLALGRAA
jgi:peptidoglycan/xylan/chitin deacetylase (PgdA/CDA1 family)